MNRDWIRQYADTGFARTLGEIAVAFLCWPERQRHAERAIAAKPAESTFIDCGDLIPQFVSFIAEKEHRDWAKEDIEAGIRFLLDRINSLHDLMYAIMTLFGVRLSVETIEPYLHVAEADGWSALQNRLDPDVIATYLLVEQGYADSFGKFADWGLVTRITDRDIDSLLKPGVSDYHVHIGGMRTPQATWRTLIRAPQQLRQLPRFSAGTLAALTPYAREKRLKERDELLAIFNSLSDNRSPLQQFWSRSELRPRSERERLRVETAAERRMLIEVWRRLLAKQDAKLVGASDSVIDLERTIDKYIYGKNQFWCWHHQAENSNPGLAAFRTFYHSTQLQWPQGTIPGGGRGIGPKLASRALSEYAAFLSQSSVLRRVELRLPPLGHPRAYHEFFRAWSCAEKEFGLDEAPIEIGFAVHFKRSLGTTQASPARLLEQLHRFLKDIDRDTALLHAYRRGNQWGDLPKRIVRIDLAGAERDLPPSAASFCMKLLRGEPTSLEFLTSSNLDDRLHRYWMLHSQRGTARQVAGTAALGQTCHAGEDFGHPLEGLYAIASAVSTLSLREGDTIGHGLALGWDIREFDRLRAPHSLISRGIQFDSLLWLHEQVSRGRLSVSSKHLINWEAFLRQEVADLYARAASQVRSIADLYDLDSERAYGLVQAGRAMTPLVDRLHRTEMLDALCVAKRRSQVPIASIVYQLSDVIADAQGYLLSDLANRGIVLELNPSSNVRVSGSASADPTPYIAILKAMRTHILATINTDDPGVFSTRIENEYAQVFSALVRAQVSRMDALRMAEELRKIGERSVYWPYVRVKSCGCDTDTDAPKENGWT